MRKIIIAFLIGLLGITVQANAQKRQGDVNINIQLNGNTPRVYHAPPAQHPPYGKFHKVPKGQYKKHFRKPHGKITKHHKQAQYPRYYGYKDPRMFPKNKR